MSTPTIPPPPMTLTGFAGIPSEKLQSEDRLKMAIVGEPKVGKSWLAATAPQPVYFFDFDDRKESLAGKPGLFIHPKPGMTDVETALNMAKYKKTKGEPIPATWVFDSVTFMQRAMEEEIFRQAPDLARTIKVGSSLGMKLRKNWDTINGIQRYVEYLIAEFSPLGNVIFIFHEKNEKDYTKSTPEKAVFTGDITVDPQYLSSALSLFNEVFRIRWDKYKKDFIVTCHQSTDFNACTTLLLDAEEKPDIMAMIQKHRANKAKLQK